MDPEDNTLHYMLGLEYLKVENYWEAVTELEKYLEIEETKEGDVGSCLGKLAEAYERTGRPDEASLVYQRAILNATFHKHADLRNELSASLQALRKDKNAKG
jgi:Tfp pilus assembly protein PilF